MSKNFSLSRVLSAANEWLLLGLVFLLPLFFLPWTLDVLEVNKQTLLLLAVSILALIFVGRILLDREAMLARGWQNTLPFLFLVGVVLSAWFGVGGYASWMGGSLAEYQSVATITALTALFYLVTHTVRKESVERRFFFAILLSGAFTLLLSLFNIFGASLFPWEFLQNPAFNTVGTANALGVFAVVVCVLGAALWLISGRPERDVFLLGWKGAVEKGLIVFTTLSTLFLLLALDFWALWVLTLVGCGLLFLFGLLRASEFPETSRFVLPMILAVTAIFFLFLPRPFTLSLPVEVTPTLQASVGIMQGTWNEHGSLLGSGPGTYVFDYAKHRPADVNQTVFWNTRFDRGHSYVLTLLSTLGMQGGVLFALFILGLLFGSLKVLLQEREHALWKLHFVLFSTWLTLTASAFLYSWDLTLQVLFYVLSAAVATQSLRGVHVKLRRSPRLGLGFSFLFVLFSIGVLTLIFASVERQVAEAHFAKAVRFDRGRASIEEVALRLDRAATLNRHNDVYYRMLSEALLFQASELLTNRSGASFSEEDTQRISSLTGASVNAAKRATDLAPYNVLNWRVRANVYRELSAVVAGADRFAKLAYERVILLEPNNPLGHTGLARAHLASAVAAGELVQASDEAVRKEARQTRNAELAAAEERLGEAIALKSDYAPAHFELARVYEEQGRLDEAFAKLDAIRTYNPLDVGVAFQLGQLSMRMERYDRAKAEFQATLTLSPEFVNARWFLASVYEIEGDLDAAIEEIKKIEELQPGQPLVSARLKRLEEGKLRATFPEPLEEDQSGSETDQP